MKIINNARNHTEHINKLDVGALFLFDEKLYLKIAHNDRYYLSFLNPESGALSATIDSIYWRIEKWAAEDDYSSVWSEYAHNVFNLTDNRFEYLEDATVTLVKGSLTVENM